MGPIALHGGGEFLPGDERFLDTLLQVAAETAFARLRKESTAAPEVTDRNFPADGIRITVVPAAASRGLPDRAAAFAVKGFETRARACGHPVRISVARVVDAKSADDPDVIGALASADLVYLPGGDPDLVPALLGPTAAGRALATLHKEGAVIAGASAGAMALADWAWTSEGGMHGLGLVRGLIVVPHYDEVRRMAWQTSLEKVAPPGLGYLGLDERTGVIRSDGRWQVAGEGAAYWFVPGSSAPVVARHAERLALPT